MCSIVRCRWGSNPTGPPTGRRRGCRRVISPCVGVRLSSATWYADTGRRLWMCKRGSCTIAHALRLWWRRRGRGCRAGPSSIDVDEFPACRRQGRRCTTGTITNGSVRRLVPGPVGEVDSNPSRVAPAEPTRAGGEVRRDGVDRAALEGHAGAYGSRQGRPGYG